MCDRQKHKLHSHSDKRCKPELVDNLTSLLKSLKTSDSSPSVDQPKVRPGYAPPNKIEKRIIHGGAGPIPQGCDAPGGGIFYPNESKFVFHYKIRHVDDDHTVLDDTRRYGKTMELYSGKEFQLDFWEYCLSTMIPGEVASFHVPADRLLSFPAVNKKLRDYMLNKNGHAVKHCCGLMGLQEQGGLGYPDLDELMVKPKPLEFIFELIRVDVPGSVRKETWIMNAEEKAQIVPVLREEGNQLYVKGEYEQAATKYREGLALLEQLALREKPGVPEWLQLDIARVPFYVNLAQCQFKLKQYYDSINSTTEALSREPNNVKAIYRRAKAYTETWDLELAATDLRKVAELMPDMTEAVASELKALASKHAEQEMKERRMLAGKLFLRPSSQAAPGSDTTV